MPWLRTGTVACTLNSTTVTGTGTGFVANARVGDAFLGPDGRWYEVANIASDTALSILPAYLGATVSAGAYALAPMQGYVKDSADQLRTLVNKFGTLAASASINALANVTGSANKLLYFSTADQMALTDLTPQARAFLFASTTALQRSSMAAVTQGIGTNMLPNTVYIGWSSGARLLAQVDATPLGSLFYQSNIIGPVGQSGGVPTGAIIETGTSSNGTYIKFADGTMICHNVAVNAQTTSNGAGNIYQSNTASFSFAANFVSAPRVIPAAADVTGAAVSASTFGAIGVSGFTGLLSSPIPTATGRLSYIAIGRWY